MPLHEAENQVSLEQIFTITARVTIDRTMRMLACSHEEARQAVEAMLIAEYCNGWSMVDIEFDEEES